MTLTEVLQSAQFVIDNKGRRSAVLLKINEWEKLINWIENIIDTKIAMQSLSELQQSGGNPEQAGWLAWEDIREEWNNEAEIEAGA